MGLGRLVVSSGLLFSVSLSVSAQDKTSHAAKYSCLNSIQSESGVMSRGSIKGYDGSQASITGDDTSFMTFSLPYNPNLYIVTQNGLKACEMPDDKWEARFEVAPGIERHIAIDGEGARIKSRVLDPIEAKERPLVRSRSDQSNTPKYDDCKEVLDNSSPRNPVVAIINEQMKVSLGHIEKRLNSLKARKTKSAAEKTMLEHQAVMHIEALERSIEKCSSILSSEVLNEARKKYAALVPDSQKLASPKVQDGEDRKQRPRGPGNSSRTGE